MLTKKKNHYQIKKDEIKILLFLFFFFHFTSFFTLIRRARHTNFTLENVDLSRRRPAYYCCVLLWFDFNKIFERERGKETFVIVPFITRLNDRLFRIILSFRDTLFRKFHICLASTSFYLFLDSHIFLTDSRDNIPLKFQ